MYETFGNTIAVPVKQIIDLGIIKESNYKKLVSHGKIKPLQRGCFGTKATADLSSFPERFRRRIEMEVLDPESKNTTNSLDEFLGQDTKAIEYYSTYEVDNDRYLPADTIKEYYANACVLNAIHLLLNDRRSLQKMCNGKVKAHWPTIAKNVMDLDRSQYPHTLPINDRRLQDRYKQYQKGGYEVLIHRNFCNKNSASIGEDSQQALIYTLLKDPRNFDNQQIADLYNMAARAIHWREITSQTVSNWRKKFDLENYAGRRGIVAFSNNKAMQVKRSAPTAPLYYWTMDGWDVELLYQKMEVKTKKDGSKYNVTTYHHRPTVVVVLDAYCKYPIGYAVGTHETPELITLALRNAAKHTKELFGSMYRTHQLQSDRYAISNMTPLYEVMAKHSTPARVKNAKAKIIEPYFNSINKKYCQLLPNWSGFGITSNKDKQPNSEYINQYKHQFPDYDGVCEQVVRLIELERAEKRTKMIDAWSKIADKDKLELSIESYLFNFGQTTGNKNMMEGSGLHVTINGIKRSYDCFDIAFRKNAHVRWEVRYDPSYLSIIIALNEDASLRFILEEKYIQPMALKDRKTGDSEQLERVKDYNDRLNKHIIDRNEKMVEALTPILEILPRLDTLNKLLITDSQGQHKNNRNAGRALKAQAIDIIEEKNDPYSIY